MKISNLVGGFFLCLLSFEQAKESRSLNERNTLFIPKKKAISQQQSAVIFHKILKLQKFPPHF
ncbi:hypothetical protein [Avibacterium paragallinarum]|uniref:hypothetical protein n=1 Tax=Avibacterium paragallinarum TaxID=728 RepID=UPI002ED9DB5A